MDNIHQTINAEEKGHKHEFELLKDTGMPEDGARIQRHIPGPDT